MFNLSGFFINITVRPILMISNAAPSSDITDLLFQNILVKYVALITNYKEGTKLYSVLYTLNYHAIGNETDMPRTEVFVRRR